MRKISLPRTPLQRVVGFDVAEEIYDSLPFISQIILDLRMEGYVMQDIADTLELPYTTVYDTFMRARHHIAMTKLRTILENRQYYREIHTLTPDNPDRDMSSEAKSGIRTPNR